MTARTAILAPVGAFGPLVWMLGVWMARQAVAILARVGLAVALIVAGGLLAPLLA